MSLYYKFSQYLNNIIRFIYAFKNIILRNIISKIKQIRWIKWLCNIIVIYWNKLKQTKYINYLCYEFASLKNWIYYTTFTQSYTL